jgi:hypothetical protein
VDISLIIAHGLPVPYLYTGPCGEYSDVWRLLDSLSGALFFNREGTAQNSTPDGPKFCEMRTRDIYHVV